MKASELKKYLTKLQSHKEVGDKWLDTVPREIQAVYFDNPYVDNLYSMFDVTMQLAFGKLYEDVRWFLYDWSAKNGRITMNDGTEYNIKSTDDYIDYLIAEHLVEND